MLGQIISVGVRALASVGCGVAAGAFYGGLVGVVHFGVHGRWDHTPGFAVGCVVVGAVLGLLLWCIARAPWGEVTWDSADSRPLLSGSRHPGSPHAVPRIKNGGTMVTNGPAPSGPGWWGWAWQKYAVADPAQAIPRPLIDEFGSVRHHPHARSLLLVRISFPNPDSESPGLLAHQPAGVHGSDQAHSEGENRPAAEGLWGRSVN
jgi:hypothetical protein